jgi:hypothetical protein
MNKAGYNGKGGDLVAQIVGALRAGVGALLFAAPAASWAGETEGKLIHVANTAHLSGFSLYTSNLYNTDRVLFAVAVVVITAGTGILLGLVTDLVIKVIGLDVSKRDLKE